MSKPPVEHVTVHNSLMGMKDYELLRKEDDELYEPAEGGTCKSVDPASYHTLLLEEKPCSFDGVVKSGLRDWA